MLGAFFLLAQFVDIDAGRYLWPFFIIVPGLLLLAGMALGGKSAAPLAIPGCVVTTVGLILLVQNATDRFESWAYAWALIPAAVGVGRFISGSRSDNLRLRRRGRRLAGWGLTMFVIFAAAFELLIFNDLGDNPLGRLLVPLLLIGGGVYLLLKRQGDGNTSTRTGETPPTSPPAAVPPDEEG